MPAEPPWLEPQATKKTMARDQGTLLILVRFILAPYTTRLPAAQTARQVRDGGPDWGDTSVAGGRRE